MDSIKNLFSGGLPDLGAPGGTPPIVGGGGGGSTGGTSGGSGAGGFIQKFLPWMLAGSGVAGTIGNIEANQARNAVLSAEMARMNAYNKMTPAQVVQGITSLEQPLSQNLIHNVGNTVQGQLAERGLSQAPGIQTQALAQGLAPYQLQEQQMAQQAFFQKLGLPISAQPSPFGPFPQTTNTSQLWQALAQNFMNKGGGGPNLVPQNVAGDTTGADLLQNIFMGDIGLTPSTQPGGG